MDDRLNVVWLLMAAALPLMALRERVSRRLFTLLLVIYVAAAVIALVAVFTVGFPGPRVPAGAPLMDA
jgi:hypothetical protein